jgi:hypothetical protein
MQVTVSRRGVVRLFCFIALIWSGWETNTTVEDWFAHDDYVAGREIEKVLLGQRQKQSPTDKNYLLKTVGEDECFSLSNMSLEIVGNALTKQKIRR